VSERFEMRLSTEMWDRIEQARGDMPRATWIKLAIERELNDPQPKEPEDA
jgi:predicted DNA-binding protein